MTKTTLDIQRELNIFRSRLNAIQSSNDNTKLEGILDKYLNIGEYTENQFQVFAEEYLITGYGLEKLNNETKTKFEQICKNGFPSFRHGDVTFWDYNRLKFCLEFNNEYAFVEGLKVITTKKPKELLIFDSNDFNSNYGKILSLMGKADQCGLYRALEALNSNERINFEAIKLHCKNGSWQSLQIWLEKRKQMEWKRIKLSDVIANLMNAKNYDRMLRNVDGIWIKSKEINFSKCVDLLFDYADYEVNEQYEENYSALHLAVMYNRPAAIIKLFRNGAYIGLKDKHNRPAIWNIEPKLLEKCFDLCIEEWQTDGPCIVFNFRNLIAPSKFYPNDMTAIEYISVTKTIHHLIEHPLIASYLFFKWNRLALLFYVDLLCNLVFTLAMSVISILYLADPETYLFTMYVFTAMFTTYVMVRRFFQTIYSSKSYLQSQPNIQKSVLQVSIVVFLLLFMIFCNPVWISFFIILITIEFFMLAGTYCHSSIYFEMFIVVFKNFVKSLILYAIFLPAFSVLFYILLRNPMPVQENGESNFNNFPTFGASVVKTIVMSTGEFDASDINFNVEDLNFNVNTISICVFIGFIFVISTVFMNLLSGLAVSDIQKLRSKARLTSLKRRIQALARYEDSLLYGNFWCRNKWPKLWKLLKLLKILQFVILFTNFNTSFNRRYALTPRHIRCLLNQKNTVHYGNIGKFTRLRNWSRWQTARMDQKTVQNAIEIREKLELEMNNDKSEISEIKDTLKTVEEALKLIKEKLNAM